ncbi:methylenetetrahydrofolate reductase 1 [Tanacetum coccineum]
MIEWLESFIGTDIVCEDLNISGLFNKQVSEISNVNMIRSVTDDEIKRAMFDIGDDKAPGPDGYTSAFFKRGWDVVGLDVCNAICDFFDNGQILKEINHTFLALIPKVTTLIKVNDYRPISCCNVIYKCISKILTNRIIKGIKEELMHNYHRNRGPPICAFKVDIQKAYDTVDWRYGYQEKDKNKDKTGRNRARDRKEREKTSSTVPSEFIGPARDPLNGPGQPKPKDI